MKFFGDFGHPEMEHIPVPVGEVCLNCSETVADGDSGTTMPFMDEKGWREAAYHAECFVMNIFGTAEHMRHECTCFGGSVQELSDKLTRRQHAKAAMKAFYEKFGPQAHA